KTEQKPDAAAHRAENDEKTSNLETAASFRTHSAQCMQERRLRDQAFRKRKPTGVRESRCEVSEFDAFSPSPAPSTARTPRRGTGRRVIGFF
ncbi:MAG: hypothetical protein E6776_06975, partial [Eggerthella sp.]|nr:hypothetical protein [Eggerthella sp.]